VRQHEKMARLGGRVVKLKLTDGWTDFSSGNEAWEREGRERSDVCVCVCVCLWVSRVCGYVCPCIALHLFLCLLFVVIVIVLFLLVAFFLIGLVLPSWRVSDVEGVGLKRL